MRSALRTLAVLRALNVHNGATVKELATATGISRPALYRILETLREAGYISVDLARTHYCLTLLVRSLADGFTDEDWVTQVARPALRDLQRKVVWPVDLATFMCNGMWRRESTRHFSPLTVDRAVVGQRLCVLNMAAGRAYLAFCRSEEREQILDNLRASPEPGNELVWDRQRLDALLEDVRRRGYGYRFGEPPMDSGAIAVSILQEDRTFGCIILTFMADALTPEEAATLYLTAMKDTAARIATGVSRLKCSGAGAEHLPAPDS